MPEKILYPHTRLSGEKKKIIFFSLLMSTSAVLCPFFVRCGCNKAVDLFCWHSSSSASWFDYVLDGMCIWWFSSGESLTCWWNCFTNLNWQIFEDEANLLRLFLLKFVIYSLLLRYKCQSLSNSLSLSHTHTYIHTLYIYNYLF